MGQLVLGMAGAGIGMMTGLPMGAQIGWMLGSMAWSLLDPQKIQGPRLQDTKVKGADYGTMRPIVYGTVRIGGIGMGQGSTSDGPNKFTEHEEKSGGKGGPEITNYRYTLSFADELCEGGIVGIRRRWANGRMVTDESGRHDDYPCVVYKGIDSQLPDPTMELIYGTGEVCPMRGVAYEVVTEINVEAFGNARPVVEREVYTTELTGALRIVKSNYATGVDATSFPVLVNWPSDGDIVISSLTVSTDPHTTALQLGKLYSQDDLAYIGPTDTPTSGLYFPDYGSGSPDYSVGIWESATNGSIALWMLVGYFLHTGTDADFDDTLGVPGDEYVCSTCLSADRTMFFLFTNKTSHTDPATKWYKYTDIAAPAASGSVSPTINLRVFGAAWHPHGTGSPADREGNSMSAENNGRYFWYADGTSGDVNIYYIDDLGNFADSGLGSVNCGFDYSEGVELSLVACESEGYAGVVRGDNLIQIGRFGNPGFAILGDIVKNLLKRAGLTDAQIDTSDLTQEVRGFVVGSQMTVRNAIDILRRAFFFDVTEYDGKIVAVNRGHDAIATIPDTDLCAHVPGTEKPDPLETIRVPEAELPRTVFINYYDYDNEHQQGSQYWRRTVTRSESDVTLDLPIVFTASEALARAQWHMHFAWLERDRFTFYVTDEWCKLRPTNVVVVRGVNIRITSATEMPDGIIKCEGVRAFAGPYSVPITDPGSSPAPGGEQPGTPGGGQPPQEPPAAKADTGMILLDVPLMTEADSDTGFRVAMYKDGTGAWSGASLMKSIDGGVNYSSVASTSASATVGTVATALGNFYGGNVIDRSTNIRVQFANGSIPTSATEEGLLNGQNIFALGTVAGGWELLQAQTITLVSPHTYDLSNLLRGRFGTEWAMGTHGTNELLVVISTTIPVPGSLAEVGLSMKYKGVTYSTAVADATAIDFTNTGVAQMALAPVLLGGGRDASGNLTLNFTPRRRGSGGWPNGVDLPATDPANWQIEIATSGAFTTFVRVIGTTVATYDYTAAQQTTDFGSPQSTVYWRVAQFSAAGLGYFAKAST